MSTHPAHITRSVAFLFTMTLVATGCGGTGSAPVAGTPSGDRDEGVTVATGAPSSAAASTTLRMGFVGGLADASVEALQDELALNRSTRVVIELSEEVDVQHTLGAEQEIVRAVADGRLDLGWVGARAFRELGVRAFDPLVAPMVLDSEKAQQAVLASNLPADMMAGLEPLGVTGLAVLGGQLRRPISAGAPITALADFHDVRFYTWRGAINALAVETLGAQNVDLSPEDRNAGIADGSIHAFENTIGFLADNPDWRTNAMTVNVNLWPSVSVLVANPASLAALSEEDRTTLTVAVEAVAARSLSQFPDERALMEEACRGGATFAAASPAALVEMETALQPLIEELRTDAEVAAHLDEIEKLTAGIPPQSPTLPDACDQEAGTTRDPGAPATPDAAATTGEVSQLDGTYAVTWTVQDLTQALTDAGNPTAAEDARDNAGTVVLTLDRGRYDMVAQDGSSCPGTFELHQDRLVMTATTRPSEWNCGDGLGQVTADARWTLTDDGLSLTEWKLTDSPSMIWFTAVLLGTKPLERAARQDRDE